MENIKDLANICFWTFTAILAYKTYVNAKKTLFNPIRSEMVKYQMKVITDFIDNHTGKGLNLDFSIDYLSLVKINYDVDYLLNIYNNQYNFENHAFDDADRMTLEYCKENLAGLFEVAKNSETLYFESTVTGDFETVKKYTQTRHIKSKEENYKELNVQRLYFTKKFYSLYSDLLNLRTNPFVPKEIQIHVEKILTNIQRNLQALYNTLTTHIPESNVKLYREIYADFELNRISHEKDLEELRKTITKYFKVNRI